MSKWVKALSANKEPSAAFPGNGCLSPSDQKISDLEKKVKKLTIERDILKKAMAYFANVPE